ncbi:hypothetical protein V865_003449 [Kwoniella europaea PYCC6329]|uniref:MYND-type domain-containing protein n=1 Tax=Kwoniella europaea PYCC6329 TaxID=1423913 RepID=A0AAX4KG59_9TREE
MTKPDDRAQPLRSTSPSRHNHIGSSSSTAPSYYNIPFRGSFANLFSLVGLSGTLKRLEDEEDDDEEEDMTDGEVDEDDEEQSAGGEVDEESLMWDAQTALISHHPELAIKLYTQAALPPFCSASACLALGNLLIRGSNLTEHEAHDFHHLSHGQLQPDHAHDHEREKVQVLDNNSTITSKIYSKFFGSSSSSSSSHTKNTSRPIPPRRSTLDLVASGWQIPKDGKRAVRDVKSMGVAGAWFVLGLSWLVQEELKREKNQVNKREQKRVSHPVKIVSTTTSNGINRNPEHAGDDLIGEEEVLSFDLKGKLKHRNEDRLNRRTTSDTVTGIDRKVESTLSDSVDTLCPPKSNPSSNSGRTSESTIIRTPGDGLVNDPFERENEDIDIEDTARKLEVMQTMYNLLQPLLKLYRHGHIQPQDPVSLPPISLQALPSVLRPRNEAEKGRNVWRLGHVVASKIALLYMVQWEEKELGAGSELKEIERLRDSVDIIVNYILAMTSHDLEAEIYFKNVISHQSTGYEIADDLIRQAAKRLDIITSTPKDENSMKGFPFPDTHLSLPTNSSLSSRQKRSSPRKPSVTTHGRKPSTSSITSLSASRIFSTPIKSSASAASLASITDDHYEPVTVKLSDRGRENENEDAMSTLRRVHAKSMADLTEAFSRHEQHEEESARYPSLDGWKLSPPIENDRSTSSQSHSNSSGFGVSQQSQRTIIPNQYYQGVKPANTNTLRPVASSPQFGTLRATAKVDSSSRRKLPFEPCSDQQINPIDPELAKAELSSALTKHVICGVCEMQGVNFPECRRCGLTFCSRECRVGEDKAGNGKKHICGLRESRKLLSGPDSTNPLIGNNNTKQSHIERTIPPVRAARVH